MKNSKTAVSGKAPAPVARGPSSVRDKLSTADYEELKATFDLFDEDGGGTIDPIEVEAILDELGLKGRSPIVFEIINGLREINRPIKFEEFLEIIVNRVGDNSSREGINRVFQLWDNQGNGFADFDSFKRIARELGETLNDDELTELMHNAYILNGTESHDASKFEEFYTIVTKKR